MRLVTRLLFVAVMIAVSEAHAGLTAVGNFGTNPGALDLFEYVPAGLPSGRPLVVVLHGCTQNAAAMEAAGWNALADAHQFAVIYPQQRSANQQLSCFSWYNAADTARNAGEALSVVQMIDRTIATHGSDPNRVYVTGLSAGGGFTSVMLATYPERFAAGSVMAGLPYRCASDVSSASGCQQMSASAQKSPQQWGDLVRAAKPGHSGAYPRVQIWHGTQDFTVATANAGELVEQWTNVWGIDQTADATDTIGPATRTRHTSGSTAAVELYLVSGMGHAIATGDDTSGKCPATAGAFFSNVHVCSTLHAASFFGLLPGSGGGGGGGGGGSDDEDDGTGSGTGSGSDDGSDTTIMGGCATTRGSSWLALLGVALAAAGARSRRSRRR